MSLVDEVASLAVATQELQAQVTNTLTECCGGGSASQDTHFIEQVTLNVPADYATLNDALAYLDDKYWAASTTPIIQLPEGEITFSSPIEIKPDGVTIQGAGVIPQQMVEHVDTQEINRGWYQSVYRVENVTGITVGMSVIVSNTMQGDDYEDPEYYRVEQEGSWEVTQVDRNYNLVMVASKAISSTRMLAEIKLASATLTFCKTKLDFSGLGINGIVIDSVRNISLKDLTIKGKQASGNYGIILKNSATLNTSNLAVNDFRNNIQLVNKSRLTQQSGYLACSGAADNGMYIEGNSTAIIPYGIFTGNNYGAFCNHHSMAELEHTVVAGNHIMGIVCSNNSFVTACNANAVWNYDLDYAADQNATIIVNSDSAYDYAYTSPGIDNEAYNNDGMIGSCGHKYYDEYYYEGY